MKALRNTLQRESILEHILVKKVLTGLLIMMQFYWNQTEGNKMLLNPFGKGHNKLQVLGQHLYVDSLSISQCLQIKIKHNLKCALMKSNIVIH